MVARTLLILAALATPAPAHAQPSTAFTYQGELKSGGVPADGAFDFELRLFDAAVGGAQVGPTLCVDDLLVAGGVFSLSLDFGDQFSAGEGRYLQIAVRQDLDDTCVDGDPFATLLPRQSLTITPFSWYAVQARNASNAESASNADSLGGQPSTFYRNAANLNAGTLSDTRLSTNVPRLNAASTFTGAVTMSNPANSFAGAGSGLTGLNASSLASGTVADARLSADIPRLSAANVFANPGNAFTGDGSGLSNLNAANIVGQVGNSQLADNAVDTFKIAPGAVINSDLADNAITTTKLVNGAVTNQKMAAGSILGGPGGVISDGSISAVDLSGNCIDSGKIIDGSVAGVDIVAGAVAGGVGGLILDNSITSADLGPGSVTASEIADASIVSGELANDAGSLSRVTAGAMHASGGNVGVGVSPGSDRLSVLGNFSVNGNATVQGAVIADGLTYTDPMTRYYTVPPAEWYQASDELTLSGSAMYVAKRNTGNILVRVGIHLPHGATVTSISAWATDWNGDDLTVRLIRRGYLPSDTGGTMASFTTSGNGGSAFEYQDTTISAPVVDNQNYGYFLEADYPGAASILNEVGLFAVRITYTTTSPLP